LRWASSWASPEAAARAFALYRKVLQGKWKRFDVASDGPGLLAGTGDDGTFRLQLTGNSVSALEGIVQ
jgi:hypothetical protein